MSSTSVVYDHFVLLVDKEEFENPPSWLTKNFNIIEGGTHAGGSSRNKLIVFQDGTYLELFNWMKEPVEFLAWADKKPGLIDFAVTTMAPVTADQNHNTVSTNLSKLSSERRIGISYQAPVAGGRKRGDGTEVKWKNSRPSFETTGVSIGQDYFPNGRIDVPFFCHDVTERTVRVPFRNDEITTHPCGAIGIDSVEIAVPKGHFDAYSHVYGALLDQAMSKDGSNDQEASFEIGVPKTIDTQAVHVIVHSAADGDAFFRERGIGIKALTLRQHSTNGSWKEVKTLDSGGVGATVKLKIAG